MTRDRKMLTAGHEEVLLTELEELIEHLPFFTAHGMERAVNLLERCLVVAQRPKDQRLVALMEYRSPFCVALKALFLFTNQKFADVDQLITHYQYGRYPNTDPKDIPVLSARLLMAWCNGKPPDQDKLAKDLPLLIHGLKWRPNSSSPYRPLSEKIGIHWLELCQLHHQNFRLSRDEIKEQALRIPVEILEYCFETFEDSSR